MATFIGDKSNAYTGELPATGYFPKLKIADFQDLFSFLEEENEASITLQMQVDRAYVHNQLRSLVDLHQNLEDRSQALFADDTTAEALYKQAVFSLVAANLIGKRLATDATKEAAGRQEALSDKASNLQTQSRQAIDSLLATGSGYTFEVI